MKKIYHVYVYDSFREDVAVEVDRFDDENSASFRVSVFKAIGVFATYSIEEVCE